MNLPGGRRSWLAIAVVLIFSLGLAAIVFADDDDDDSEDAAAASTTTTTTSDDTTTTVPAGDDTTTTTVAATTTTTRAGTTPTTRASTSTTRGPSTTVAASSAACGSGQASVAFAAKDLVTDAVSSAFTPQATVANQVDQPIEVEEIVLEVIFPGGDVRTVRFSTSGTVVAPGTSASFTADRLTSARRYESARFTRFTYFTQGRQAACRVTTP